MLRDSKTATIPELINIIFTELEAEGFHWKIIGKAKDTLLLKIKLFDPYA